MFFKKRMRGSARGVASADRLTDLRIKQARTLTAGDSIAGAVSAVGSVPSCSASAHSSVTRFGRAAG
jgi:hypothetical protein